MTCPHPFRSLRYDGLMIGHPDGPLASLTCMACRNTMTAPVRADVAAKVAEHSDEYSVDPLHGGALGRGSSEVVMDPTLQQPCP